MTTQEIKDLIASKIAGQGTMVDVGGALPTILKEIVDALGNIPEEVIFDFSDVSPMDDFYYVSVTRMVEILTALKAGKKVKVKLKEVQTVFTCDALSYSSNAAGTDGTISVIIRDKPYVISGD